MALYLRQSRWTGIKKKHSLNPYAYSQCNVMSMWSSRWHFTNKSVTGAPYSIKGYSYSLSHSRTLWWRVRWLKQCRFELAAKLQQWRRRTNRWRKSIPRLSSSHQEGLITQRGASCGRYDQRRLRSTPKTPTWTYVGSWVEGLSKVWWRRADKGNGMQEHITGTEFSPELSASVVHGEVELCALTSLQRTRVKQ